MANAAAIEGGFADLVLDGQRVFRATMDALANPGMVQPLGAIARPPAPLTVELAALALTLCDHDSPVWLDAALAGAPVVADWLRFHTGAPIVGAPAEAMFALIADPLAMPALDTFGQGTDEYPDRSTTLIIAVVSLEAGAALTLSGPGIRDVAVLSPAPLVDNFAAQWAENRQRFPRGIDAIFAGAGQVAGLPRSSRIVEG